ncbi:MAG: hypothetical protein ABJD11_17005 [Gemmatimonadota bacterium]
MRWLRSRASLALLAAVGIGGCSDSTAPSGCGAPAQQVSSHAPDFSGKVSQVTFEGGNGPAGPIAQFDVWITIPPSVTPNAGVVVAQSAPVFIISAGGRTLASSACAIRSGDQVQVWHDQTVGYGAVQSPAGAPVYNGTQLVIVR